MKSTNYVQLVKNAKNDHASLLKLIELFMPLIHKREKQLYFLEKSDVEQEMILAIIEAVQNISVYKTEGECIKYIENALKFKYFTLYRKNIQAYTSEVSYEENIDSPLSSFTFSSTEFKIDAEKFLETLPHRQQQICKLLMCGYTDTEIGNHLGISRQYVNRIKKKLFYTYSS